VTIQNSALSLALMNFSGVGGSAAIRRLRALQAGRRQVLAERSLDQAQVRDLAAHPLVVVAASALTTLPCIRR
jgi:hypothetical protein